MAKKKESSIEKEKRLLELLRTPEYTKTLRKIIIEACHFEKLFPELFEQ